MKILLVEDDKNLNDTLTYYLLQEGYCVDSCFHGDDAWFYMEKGCADMIILDRMLPGYSGTDLLKKLRDKGDTTPVLLLTALGTLQDRVEGLDMGADDYLVKPFDIEELGARVRSLLRRQSGNPLSGASIHYGDLSLQEEVGELSGPGGTCSLSKKEGELLQVLLRNPRQTLSRGQLLNKVWGLDNDVEEGNLDNYIFFLRRRLKSVSSQVTITTIRGIGYRLEQ